MGYFILFGIVVFVISRFYQDIRDFYARTERSVAPIRARIVPVPEDYIAILKKYFPYYNQLSEENKAKFAQKVCHFIYGKQFIPRDIDEVTLEAKILIAATAVQLTFGLSNVYLRHFNKILVYPNDYYSSITKRNHKGEVNPMFRIIVLSWQSFVNGFINPTDAVNLGLHEMAHALRLENMIRSRDYQYFDESLIEKFDAHATRICQVTNWSDTFFRPYACANEHEFFSVAVENFFERSHEFKSALPELYSIMSRLLNQDPTRVPSPILLSDH
jgi:MtfA peptidase